MSRLINLEQFNPDQKIRNSKDKVNYSEIRERNQKRSISQLEAVGRAFGSLFFLPKAWCFIKTVDKVGQKFDFYLFPKDFKG